MNMETQSVTARPASPLTTARSAAHQEHVNLRFLCPETHVHPMLDQRERSQFGAAARNALGFNITLFFLRSERNEPVQHSIKPNNSNLASSRSSSSPRPQRA